MGDLLPQITSMGAGVVNSLVDNGSLMSLRGQGTERMSTTNKRLEEQLTPNLTHWMEYLYNDPIIYILLPSSVSV